MKKWKNANTKQIDQNMRYESDIWTIFEKWIHFLLLAKTTCLIHFSIHILLGKMIIEIDYSFQINIGIVFHRGNAEIFSVSTKQIENAVEAREWA